MNYRLTVLLILLAFSKGISLSQTDEEFRLWASEIIENMAAESEEELDYSYLMDDVIKLFRSPININIAGREELERIFFLSDAQVEALLFQRYQVGKFSSIFELQAVEGFDRQLIEWLEPLIVFDIHEHLYKRRFRPSSDLFLRTQWTIEKPRGYHERDDGTTPFQGDRLRLYSRFELQPVRNFEMGFVTEKDPGEPIFNHQIKTMDYVSGYLMWKPDKFIKQIIVGQYRISAGQGLALQSGMAPRKSSLTTSIRNRNVSLRPSLSVNEAGGMSGALISFGSRDLTINPFVSVKMRDARIVNDEKGNTVVTSMKTDGYHRTLTELEQRKNVQEEVYGAQIRYYTGKFILEGGYLNYRLEYPLQTVSQPYNRYYFRGNQNNNGWFAFEGSIYNVYMFGEAAFNDSTEPALVSGTLFSIGGLMNMVMMYRRIPLNYKAPLGAPFTEAGQPAGESGFYTGIELGLPGKLSLSAYLDYFEHKWLRYQTKAPSSGYDFLTFLTHRPERKWENSVRYRYREKVVNLTSETPDFPVGVQKQNQLRFQTRFNPDQLWSFTTRMDFQFIDSPGKNSPYGFYMGQDIRYRSANGNWTFVTRYAMIDAEDYDTRVYAYEPDVLYSFSTPAYYGRGSRWIFMGKWRVRPKLDIWMRFAQWHYTNRHTIGTGNMTIDSNVSRECKIQVRWRY